jgi:glycosyltransferase involved in cell wall biosynthesis
MRAGMFLEALAQRHRVSLLVVPIFGEQSTSSQALIERFCEALIVVEPRPKESFWQRFAGRAGRQPELVRLFGGLAASCPPELHQQRFDVIHAFRLYTAPLALALAKRMPGRPALHLDLDDIESVTRRRIAALHASSGDSEAAGRENREAARYGSAEAKLIPAFERVYVCSRVDASRIASRARHDPIVVPNAVRLPGSNIEPLTSHPFTFLFVGTLGYSPNQDAVRFFCTEVLPLIRRTATAPFLVRIVGAGLTAGLTSLSAIPEVRLIGRVPDVGVEYADADAVIVPLRGGGGTRIKVLEAFGHRRPVVSTTMGIEGIEATPGEHYLKADTPEAFAAQCLRLIDDAELRAHLAGHAEALVHERYTQQRINELISGLP